MPPPGAQLMDGSGDQLFARACLSLDQNVAIQLGNLLNGLAQGLDLRALANDARGARRVVDLLSQAVDLLPQQGFFQEGFLLVVKEEVFLISPGFQDDVVQIIGKFENLNFFSVVRRSS